MISRQSTVHDHHFPSEFHHIPEQRKSCPAVVPLTSNQIERQWETVYGDHCIRPFQETFNNRENVFTKPYSMRRHSWSHSICNVVKKTLTHHQGGAVWRVYPTLLKSAVVKMNQILTRLI